MTRQTILKLVKRATAMTVQSGPFAGMQMNDSQSWGDGEDVGPQLLGTYEQELHAQIQTFVARRPTTVVNVGCAEGYYAVGLARALPHAQIYAFDTDEKARAACLGNAILNGVADRIKVEGECSPERLAAIAAADPNILAIIDCEGCEKKLLESEASIEALSAANIIVEAHGTPSGNTLPGLQRILQKSHRLRTLTSGARNPHVFSFLNKCSDADKWMLICENRPHLQNWLVCEKRAMLSGDSNVQVRDIKLKNGRVVSFPVTNQPGKESFFVLGVRKSGSTIFNSICHVLANQNGYNYVNVAGTFFHENVRVGDWVNDPAVSELLAPGNVFGAFRNMPIALSKTSIFKASKKILLVRDPRDGLVSEHFSNAYSHSIPKADDSVSSDVTREMERIRKKTLATGIDQAVLERAIAFNKTLLEYSVLLGDSTLLLLKYEDVITQKTKLIEQLCAHFEWSVSPGQLQKILGWADVVPGAENEKAFIRRVIPGDHAEKLKRETIDELNKILRPSMEAFGYELS